MRRWIYRNDTQATPRPQPGLACFIVRFLTGTQVAANPVSRRLLAGPTAHVVQLIENRLRGLRMHHKAALVVVVLLGVLAEWFFVAYEPPPKSSRGEKAAFWFLMACAACWLLFVTGP